ncbi:hypothetical protein [Cupriavidus necator]
MTLTDFCQYSEVRAILGVGTADIEDETLALPLYLRLLTLALSELGTALPADYVTTAAKPSKTADESRFVDLVQVFSGYLVARELLPALPQFAVKRFVQGKSDMERPQFDPEATKKAILDAIGRLSAAVSAAYALLTPASAALPAARRTIFAASGLGTDPVTGA